MGFKFKNNQKKVSSEYTNFQNNVKKGGQSFGRDKRFKNKEDYDDLGPGEYDLKSTIP